MVSREPILTDLRGFVTGFSSTEREKYPNGYQPGGYWGDLYFQGFPPEYWFGPHAENPRQFSTYMSSDYELYTFLFLLMRDRLVAR